MQGNEPPFPPVPTMPMFLPVKGLLSSPHQVSKDSPWAMLSCLAQPSPGTIVPDSHNNIQDTVWPTGYSDPRSSISQPSAVP